MMFMEPPIESYAEDHLGCRSHISYSHTVEDVDLTLEAAEEAVAEAIGSGSLGG